MFVQALVEYANAHLSAELEDESWEERPVQFVVEIGHDGRFLSLVERMKSVPGKKKVVSVPEMLSVPRSPVTRKSGLSPLLGVDDIRYVLGVGAWTAEEDGENHTKRHDAFVRLIREAAHTTRAPELEACEKFYAQPVEVQKARDALSSAKTATLVALSVDGPVVLLPAIKAYWREHYQHAFQERVAEKGGFGECLVSGKFGPVAPTHEKIKGVVNLGGQPVGVSLMSFDKDAFQSYGWSQNENSPVSPSCAMAYTLALNHLLRTNEGRRRDISGVGFIFWVKHPEEFDPFGTLEQADEKQVAALLSFDPGADPKPNEFYMAGVSGNGGRLRVRYWVSDSLARIKHNLGRWFEGLCVAGFEEPAKPVRFWQLLYAIDRDGKPPADRVIALLRRAIEGPSQPLGHKLLGAALERLRRSRDNPIARMGLVRMCVNDLIYVRSKGDKESYMEEKLDPGQTHYAYLCGRLLAEYEGLQYAVSRVAGQAQVNQTVADRYYSLASTYPTIAFPKLEDLSRKHLRKLRRDHPGAAIAIDQRLQELHQQLEKSANYRFPGLLSLEDQGRFALGYHHQKAHSFAQAKARRDAQEKEAQGEENQ